jgi:two-component system response regulator PilR (NtrC family)
VIPVYLPPLRARLDDIPLLAEHFLQKFSQKLGKSIRGITPEAVSLLMVQEWKGNVRELENVMERAVALATGDRITPQLLQECLQRPTSPREVLPTELPSEGVDLENLIGNMEKNLLLKALQRSKGIKKEAARLLGLNFRSFRYRLEKYGITKGDPMEDIEEGLT